MTQTEASNPNQPLPARADITIIGGGIVGCSIAYHLAQTSDQRVLLLERGQLTCGTTWHAAGLVAQLRATANLTRLARYSRKLYQQLNDSGEPTGYRDVGGLTLATHPERVVELQRQGSMARGLGVVCQWLQPAEIIERWPMLAADQILGGLYLPQDGQTSPVDTTLALARRARAEGAQILEHTAVTGILTNDGKVTGVTTSQGTIQCPQLVLAAGLWSRKLARSIGVDVPLYPAEHFYAVSESLPTPVDFPVLREPDAGFYIKPDAGRILVGCFESDAKPLDPDRLPADFSFDELPFDLDHFTPYLAAAGKRLPQLNETGIRTWFNGPESFTPDGSYILGPSPQMSGLFVAAGFNSIGIQSAGGVGQVVARWLLEKQPPMDLWEVDVRRFMPHQNQTEYLVERTSESLGLLYAMHWPFHQHTSARDQLRSPLYAQTKARGACFGEVAGWERPNWYQQDYQANQLAPAYQYSYGRQNWFEHAATEHRAAREQVALFDQSSFSKYRIQGTDACALLNWLCTADMDVPLNKVVYCQWLNERGGIEADVTVTRWDVDDYWVVSAAATRVRDLAWLARWQSGFDVRISDITESFAVIGIMGPQSRTHLLNCLPDLTAAQLNNTNHPFGMGARWQLANMTVRALRITYVGSLGWELYVDWREASELFASLTALPITLAGYHAMDSLRLEKGYRHWGHDITDEDTPLEAGLGFTIDWAKPDFCGRQALAAQREVGINKRLLGFSLQDSEVLLLHDEPIWWHNQHIGHITSGAYAHSLGCSVGLGYLNSTAGLPLRGKGLLDEPFEIEVAGTRYFAQAHSRPLIDPKGLAINATNNATINTT